MADFLQALTEWFVGELVTLLTSIIESLFVAPFSPV